VSLVREPLSSVDDRMLGIENATAELSARLALLEERLARIEQGQPSPAPDSLLAEAEQAFDEVLPQSPLMNATFAGRSLIVLGGGFLLRALAESGAVPLGWAVAAGLLYAAVWIFMSQRRAADGAVTNSLFHGVVASLIAFPLIYEAAVKFKIVSPSGAALLIAGIAFLTLWVASRWSLHALAWVTVILAIVTSLSLVMATRTIVPFAYVCLAVSVAAAWRGYEYEWHLLRWPLAVFANVLMLNMSMAVLMKWSGDGAGAAVTAQLLLFGAYFAMFATRRSIYGVPPDLFEIFQTAGALVCGVGAALWLGAASGRGAFAGAAAIGLAVLCWAAAYVWPRGREEGARTLYAWTALVLITAALPLAGGRFVLAAAALAASIGYALHARSRSERLSIHLAAAWLTIAAVASGLMTFVTTAILAPAEAFPSMLPPMAAAVAAGAAAVWWTASRRGEPGGGGVRASLLVALALTMAAVVGIVVVGTCSAMQLASAPQLLALVRTLALAAIAVVAAAAGRLPLFRDAALLVTPILAIGGLKLIFEDFRIGAASTLFVSLAAYGIALIVAPRMKKQRRVATA
jgi:hypothetical protein